MAENDNIFKKLIETYPQDYVSRLMPGATFKQMLTIELPSEPLRVDALLLVELNNILCILHIEMQTGRDPTMAERLAEYAIRIFRREHMPVYSFVIYLEKTSLPDALWKMDGPLGAAMTFQLHPLALWEEQFEPFLQGDHPGLLPFIPFMKDATPAILPTIATKLQTINDPNERGNAINFLLTFASRRFGEQAVIDFLGRFSMTDPFIVESPWYQYVKKSGLQEGKEEGKKVGLQEGKKVGLQEGKKAGLHEAYRHIVTMQLMQRFGPLANDMSAALEAADDATLDALALLLITGSLEDVRAHLGLS